MTKWCKYRGSQGDYKGSLTVLLSAKSQHCLGWCQKKHLHLPDISYLFWDLQRGYFCLRVKTAQCECYTLNLALILTLLWINSIHSLLIATNPGLNLWLKRWLTSNFQTMKQMKWTSKVVDFNISDHLTKKMLKSLLFPCSLVYDGDFSSWLSRKNGGWKNKLRSWPMMPLCSTKNRVQTENSE